MKRILAICDDDHPYLYKIYDYFEKHKLSDFEVKIFDSLEEVKAYGIKQPFEILVVHEKYINENENISQVTCLVLLSENPVTDQKRYHCVSKYQSMENFKKQLLQIYAESENGFSQIRHAGQKLEVYSFVSLHNKEKMSLYALAAGQLMAKQNKKVLYINFQPFCGVFNMVDKESKYDLSDLIYYVTRYEEKTMLKIECIKQRVNELDCLPPVKDFEDLLRLSRQQWKDFLQILMHHTEYEYMIFDCEASTLGLMDILQESDQIFLPESKKKFEKGIENKFLELIEKRENFAMNAKIDFLTTEQEGFQNIYGIERLGNSEIGKYMARKLKCETESWT